jgi:ferrous iron transport protein B
VNTFRIDYGEEFEDAITVLISQINDSEDIGERFPHRWFAVALLDNDPGLEEYLDGSVDGEALLARRNDLRAGLGPGIDTAIAGRRYDVVHDITASSVDNGGRRDKTTTDRIDAIVINRYLGLPIFLAAMWLVFKITTDIAGAFLDWIGSAVSGPISDLATSAVSVVGLEGTWAESLIVDGAIAGVGAILVFLPVLFSLYLALAFLEDSGYMARAAFVMDRLMRGVGLQGKSFLPMLVGFGCTVPAIYATRTLDNERDRVMTAMLVPFMSCGARLPVYVLMSTIFFPRYAGLVVFGMYLLGIAVALVIGVILRRTALPVDRHVPTIMELPPYRMPTVHSIWFHTWVRAKAFLKDAGSIIFVTMMVVWLLMAIPVSGTGSFADTDVSDSAFAAVAGTVAPVFHPAGFGSWEAAGSLMSGFVAKEVVIGTMAQVYGIEAIEVDQSESRSTLASLRELGTGLGGAVADAARAIPAMVGIDLGSEEAEQESSGLMRSLRRGFEESSGGHGALAALAFMVFVLIYTPCMAAVAAIRHEIGTRWMWTSIIGQSLLAWAMAVAVFQVGLIVGAG